MEQIIVQRQTYRGLSGVVAHPFDRTRRIELGTGYDQLTHEQEVRTRLTSLQSGRLISDETSTSSIGGALHLGSASVASVLDAAVFGATSPVAGQRGRLEISPTFGSLSFTGAVADYRRYFMPVSFYTIAARVLHAGRYGSGGEDPRLLPLFIGYPDLVRGYGIGSFTAAECTASPTGSCQELDRLLGSRMSVGNLEFRFPLLRPFGLRSRMYGPLPVEVALFADGGVAWHRGARPALFGGDRKGVSSAGVTFRVNLFGFAVAQIDFARPFQRPTRGWTWTFSLAPSDDYCLRHGVARTAHASERWYGDLRHHRNRKREGQRPRACGPDPRHRQHRQARGPGDTVPGPPWRPPRRGSGKPK